MLAVGTSSEGVKGEGGDLRGQEHALAPLLKGEGKNVGTSYEEEGEEYRCWF